MPPAFEGGVVGRSGKQLKVNRSRRTVGDIDAELARRGAKSPKRATSSADTESRLARHSEKRQAAATKDAEAAEKAAKQNIIAQRKAEFEAAKAGQAVPKPGQAIAPKGTDPSGKSLFRQLAPPALLLGGGYAALKGGGWVADQASQGMHRGVPYNRGWGAVY